jgi:hypothetical protein
MNRDVRDIYISLLTNSPRKRRVAGVEENEHNVCLMKANVPNANLDTFNVGNDIYATFKTYTVVLSQDYFGGDMALHYLFPNIDYFRKLWR